MARTEQAILVAVLFIVVVFVGICAASYNYNKTRVQSCSDKLRSEGIFIKEVDIVHPTIIITIYDCDEFISTLNKQNLKEIFLTANPFDWSGLYASSDGELFYKFV